MIYGQNSLGTVSPLPDSVVNYQVPIPSSPTPTSGGGSGLDTVLNWFNKLAPAVQTAKTTYDQFKNTGTPATTVVVQQAPASSGMSKNAKIALGVGGAALVGTVIYLATRKKKKK